MAWVQGLVGAVGLGLFAFALVRHGVLVIESLFGNCGTYVHVCLVCTKPLKKGICAQLQWTAGSSRTSVWVLLHAHAS